MQTELYIYIYIYIYIYNENTYKEGLYAILSIVGLFEHWAIDGWPNGYSVILDGRTPDHYQLACIMI